MTGSIPGGSFQIHFSFKPLQINHDIWTVDAKTSFKEDYGLNLIALPESIFRPTIMIFKILKGDKQSPPNAAFRNG